MWKLKIIEIKKDFDPYPELEALVNDWLAEIGDVDFTSVEISNDACGRPVATILYQELPSYV